MKTTYARFAVVILAIVAPACSVQEGSGASTDGTPNATDSGAAAASAATDSGDNGGGVDAGSAGGVDAGAPTGPGSPGQPCSADSTCDSGICYRAACAAACASVGDCGANQDCSSDDGKRLLCVTRAYNANLGATCAATGVCKDGLTCSLIKEASGAVCTGACKDDTDCPMNMDCSRVQQGQTYCATRKFCGGCLHAGNCAEGGACVKMGGGSYCTTSCTPGSTECPRYASCNDIGDGNFQCVHQAGSCVGDGGQCSACNTNEQCAGSGTCISFPFANERFCANDCSNISCPNNGKCIQTGQTTKGCIPAYKAPALPTCVNKLIPTMEVGDIMSDFAMVGVTDTDGDGDLVNEDLRLFKLSHFAEHHKLIFFNAVAGWCGYCQAETKEFPKLNYEMYPKGVVIFQVIYDGYNQKQWTVPNEKVLRSWVKGLKPQGVIGVDPERHVSPINTGGSTPLNMIIDAKTRKVLEKWNGANMANTKMRLNKHLVGK